METYKFDSYGLPTKKTVKYKNDPEETFISESEYTYNSNKLMITAEDKIFDRTDQTKVLEKKISWIYDNKANVTQEKEEYTDDSICPAFPELL